MIENYDEEGKNLVKIVENIVEFLKNVLIYYNSSEYFEVQEEKQMYAQIGQLTSENKVYEIIDILLDIS
jgi:hypothetical protein